MKSDNKTVEGSSEDYNNNYYCNRDDEEVIDILTKEEKEENNVTIKEEEEINNDKKNCDLYFVMFCVSIIFIISNLIIVYMLFQFQFNLNIHFKKQQETIQNLNSIVNTLQQQRYQF
ncbi:hypothetical protein ABK040_006969 [Willaertia magna]